MRDKLKYVDVDEVKVGKRFREDYGDIDSLSESIADKGVLQPITIYSDMELISGARRLMAAKKAGLKKIPALVRERDVAEGELELREIELVENVFRKDFSWFERARLIAHLHELCSKQRKDWSQRKTAQLLNHSHPMTVNRALAVVEAAKHIPEVASLRSEDEALRMVKRLEEGLVVQELRRRQNELEDRGVKDTLKVASDNYIIGDTFECLKKLNTGTYVTLIEVDPPYGIALDRNKRHGLEMIDHYYEVPASEYPDFINRLLKELYRVAWKDCWMVFWTAIQHSPLVADALKESGWQFDPIPCIWYKVGQGQTNNPEYYLGRTYEAFYICWKGKPVLQKRGRSNVFAFPPAKNKYHPAEKPIELLMEILSLFVIPSQTILVPFLGSGVTLRAAYLLGYRGWGFELSSAFKDRFLLAVEEDTRKTYGKEEASDGQ